MSLVSATLESCAVSRAEKILEIFMTSGGNSGRVATCVFSWVEDFLKSRGSRPVPQFVLLPLEEQAGNLRLESEKFSGFLAEASQKNRPKEDGISFLCIKYGCVVFLNKLG